MNDLNRPALDRTAAEERLLDAALETEHRPAPIEAILARAESRRPRSRHTWLVAAVLLLGIGVAIGIAVDPWAEDPNGTGESTITSAQDPQDPQVLPEPALWQNLRTPKELGDAPTNATHLRVQTDGIGLSELSRFTHMEELQLHQKNPAIFLLGKAAPLDLEPMLQHETLESLSIQGVLIDADGLRRLRDLPKLRHVYLQLPATNMGQNVTFGPDIAKALGALPVLEELELSGMELAEGSIPALTGLKRIRHLGIHLSVGLSEDDLLALTKLETLTSLAIRNQSGGIARFLHQVRKVELVECLTPKVLKGLQRIRKLDLLGNDMNAELLAALPAGLAELDLSGCRVEGTLPLERLPRLHTLRCNVQEGANPIGIAPDQMIAILKDRPWRCIGITTHTHEGVLDAIKAQTTLEVLDIRRGPTAGPMPLELVRHLPALRGLKLPDYEPEMLAPLADCKRLRWISIPRAQQKLTVDDVRAIVGKKVIVTTH